MKLTYSIKCVLRPDKIKANGTVPVYYSVRVGPMTTRLPTGKTVSLSNWNAKESCPKKNNTHNQLLTAYFNGKMSEWHTKMLQLETIGTKITLTIATDFFKENNKVTLFSYWEEQMGLWKDKGENTLKSYRSALRMLKSFNSKLNFGDLNRTTIQKFDLFMANEKGNSVGGRFPKHKNLKSVINMAIMDGHMKENPYRFFPIKSSEAKRAFLSIDEVKVLMNLEIPEKDQMLDKTRDYFIFSCLSGLRFSDLVGLKFGDIKSDPDAIAITMIKTKKEVMVPLVAPAKAIIEKYNKLTIRTPLTTVFPYVDNQVLNRNLKELMKLSGIKKLLTFHVSRHTFGATHIQLGTNIVHLKDLMGHTKIQQTQLYANSQTEDLFTSMNKMQSVYDMPHAV